MSYKGTAAIAPVAAGVHEQGRPLHTLQQTIRGIRVIRGQDIFAVLRRAQ